MNTLWLLHSPLTTPGTNFPGTPGVQCRLRLHHEMQGSQTEEGCIDGRRTAIAHHAGNARIFRRSHTHKMELRPPWGSFSVSGHLHIHRRHDWYMGNQRASKKRRPQWPPMTRRSGPTHAIHLAPSIPAAMPILAWSWSAAHQVDWTRGTNQ